MKRKCIGFYYRCRFNVCLWAFLSLIGLVFLSSPAFALQSGDFHYMVNADNTVTITATSCPGGATIIPDVIDGKPVVGIGSSAFRYCSRLTSVTIGNNITSIGNEAFFLCSGLTRVTIGNNVTSIGANAFGVCSHLTGIVVDASNTVYSSQDGVLYNKAKTVLIQYPGGKSGGFTIPDSVTRIGDYAFYYCSALTSVTIGNSVTSIGSYAFEGCTGLTSIVVDPNNTAYSSQDGVLYNKAMTELILYPCGKSGGFTIPDSVTRIGDRAFYYCKGLTSVTIPNSVTTIGNDAFLQCSGLTNVIIGNSVTSIGYYAFEECSSLTSVTIPDSVVSIGDGAFGGCSGLTSVTIPDSVTLIGPTAFFYCSRLASVIIGNSVISIGRSAFEGCRGLTSVTIPNSVTSIGSDGFARCTGLTSVVIGNSVTSIGDYAFGGCNALTSVVIPNSVTSIGNSVFSGCSSLTSVTIPDNVTSIGDYAFSYCSSLTRAYFLGNAPSLGTYVFYDVAPNFTVCYTAGSTGFTTPTWEGYLAAVCSPQINIVNPQANTALQDGIVFKGTVSDFSGIYTVSFYVREPDGGEGIPIGHDDLEASYNITSGYWEYPFDTTELQDGNYVVFAKATDNAGNEGMSSVVPFSIRNWAVITMLPDTRSNKAGRTMPIKFSLRIAKSVDPSQPFVYNEDLEIRIYDAKAPGTILQRSVFGTHSTDYRIEDDFYITNFKTAKTPATYVVEIWRPSANFMVGSFTFKTVK